MLAQYFKYFLTFKQASGTSRGILTQKETFFLVLKDEEKQGIGECALFRGLSADDVPHFESKLAWVCKNIDLGKEALLQDLISFPSIYFGLEQAFKTWENANSFIHFPSLFTEGKDEIPINGLIWMGEPQFMKEQIRKKISEGFDTIKLKIGAIDFETELSILKYLRTAYKTENISIRVDANGAFSVNEALDKLKRLSDFDIHSIEQPIKAGQWEKMATLCAQTPVAIALDEELIGIFDKEQKNKLLTYIKPQYIILKPSLTGGFKGSDEWIQSAEKRQIGWWITSALESNIGLNAIAQYTYTLNVKTPQGLGTGGLFINNFDSPLQVINGKLKYNPELKWNLMEKFQIE